MKILVAAICVGLQVISAQETTAPVAVTGEPPAGKMSGNRGFEGNCMGIMATSISVIKYPVLFPIIIIG